MYLFLAADAPFLGWVVTTDIVVYAIAAGVFLSFFAYWFVQNVAGSLVRALLADGKGEENAKSLKELGKDKGIYRFLLREGKVLRRTVSVAGGKLSVLSGAEAENEAKDKEADNKADKAEKPKKNVFMRLACWFKKKLTVIKYDFENAKFFITEEDTEKAEAKYSASFKTWLLPIIFVLCIVVAFGMTYLLPIIMDFIRN